MGSMNQRDRDNRLLSKNETAFASALQDALGKAIDDGDQKVTSIWAHLDATQRALLAGDFVAGVNAHATQTFSKPDDPEPASPPQTSRGQPHSSGPETPPASQTNPAPSTSANPPVPRGYPTNFNPLAGFPELSGPHAPNPSAVIASALGGWGGMGQVPSPVEILGGLQQSFLREGPSAPTPAHQPDLREARAPDPKPATRPDPAPAGSDNADPSSLLEDARQSSAANSTAPHFWPLWMDQQDSLLKQCLKLMSGNLDDAQDALSEAMVKASVKFEDSMEDIRNHRAWLSRIVHNACIDLHRQNRRKAEYHEESHASTDDALPSIAGREEPSPEENCLTGEMFAHLEEALANLPDKLRRPLLMRCVQDRSYDDIAQNLGLSNCAVRKRVQLARDQLRDAGIR